MSSPSIRIDSHIFLKLAAKVSADAGLKAHPAVVKFLDDWKSIENTDMKAWEAKARALLSGVKSEEQIRDEINNLSKGVWPKFILPVVH